MKCPHCQGNHPDTAKFCPVTGLSLEFSAADTQPTVVRRSRLPFGLLIVLGLLLLAGGAFLIWRPLPVSKTPTPAATITVPAVTIPTSLPLLPVATDVSIPLPLNPTVTPQVSAATQTPWPTNTPDFIASPTPSSGTPWAACPGAYNSRLRKGGFATVSLDPPQANNVRSGAGVNQQWVGKIQPGELVEIVDGPRCVAGWVWWKIESQETDVTGWTSEGDEEDYWLVPVK